MANATPDLTGLAGTHFPSHWRYRRLS